MFLAKHVQTEVQALNVLLAILQLDIAPEIHAFATQEPMIIHLLSHVKIAIKIGSYQILLLFLKVKHVLEDFQQIANPVILMIIVR